MKSDFKDNAILSQNFLDVPQLCNGTETSWEYKNSINLQFCWSFKILHLKPNWNELDHSFIKSQLILSINDLWKLFKPVLVFSHHLFNCYRSSIKNIKSFFSICTNLYTLTVLRFVFWWHIIDSMHYKLVDYNPLVIRDVFKKSVGCLLKP